MTRRTRPSFRRRALTGAGCLMSAASLSAGVAAQTAKTGWEDVKPTGWPSAGRPAAAAPTRTADAPRKTAEVASAAPVRRASRSASRSSRRKARGVSPRRPSAPAWITLEWDAPPPIDVALDWRPALLDGRAVAFVSGAPDVVSAFQAPASLDLTEADTPASEARLPVATMIHAAAPAPAAPRPAAFARGAAATPAPGFKGFMTRLAAALGIRRDQPADPAPRIARAGGDTAR